MTAPTFVSSTNTTYSTTSPQTTASIAVQSGDVLVATGFGANAFTGTNTTISISTASGSTSAWTLLENASWPPATNQYAYIQTWSATATATGNITVTFTRGAGSSVSVQIQGIVKVWRNSGGIGAHAHNDNGAAGSSAPTINVTTTGANSALDYSSDDWNDTTGTATFTASVGTPVSDLIDQTDPTGAFNYSFHVVDSGAAGAKTMGMSAPATQRWVATVVEVLGPTVAPSVSAQILPQAKMPAGFLGPQARRVAQYQYALPAVAAPVVTGGSTLPTMGVG